MKAHLFAAVVVLALVGPAAPHPVAPVPAAPSPVPTLPTPSGAAVADPAWSGPVGLPRGRSVSALSVATRPYPADGPSLDGRSWVISTPGAVYDGWQFDHLVDVRAPGVRITHSLLRGGLSHPDDAALLLVRPEAQPAGQPSAVVEDTTIRPRTGSGPVDGVRGSHVTLRRVEITGTVDGVHVHGSADPDDPQAGHVRVEASWIHDLVHLWDGSHADGTHNDGVQVVGGTDVVITGTRFSGTIPNADVMVTQDRNRVSGLTVQGNWLSGGACSVNLSDAGEAMAGIRVVDNVFARGTTTFPDCAILATPASAAVATLAPNSWDDGTPVAPRPP